MAPDSKWKRNEKKPRNQMLNADILDRLPPQSMQAEKGVLCSMLLDTRCIDDVAVVLREGDFYAEANRVLFRHIMDMHMETKDVDVTLLAERLSQHAQLESIGGEAYLAEVLHAEAVAVHAVSYAEVIRDKASLREMIFAGTDIIRNAYESTDSPRELVGQAENRIFEIHDGRSNDSVERIGDLLLRNLDLIDTRLREGGATGIATGFVDLDKILGGLHHSELIILAARPSMGKTALATNIADHVSVEEGVGVLLVSLEMAALELAQRMVCARGHIDGRKFRSGFASDEDHEKFAATTEELGVAPLYIDDSPSRTITEIAAVARRLKRRDSLGLIVIDYLQLIQPENSQDPRQEQVAKIARRLKGLARELEIPILCLAQLNRQAEASKDNIPRLSHLRESGAIEQDADVVMFVHREEYYHTPEEAEEKGIKGKAQIIVGKQRNGPIGPVDLYWIGQYTQFVNVAKEEKHEDYVGGFDGADSGF